MELAHLLLIDIVGYSKLLVDEQIEVLQRLNQIVRECEAVRTAQAHDKLVLLPTGDGIALLFFKTPEQPVRCAVEVTEALRGQSEFQVRMGIHSGPVSQIHDVNDRLNIAGTGINIAKRVV